MKPSFTLLLSSFLILFVLLFLFAYNVPLPIPSNLDFQVLYHADHGLLLGIQLYDHASQAEMIARLAHVTVEQVFILPFPYPPWYALSTVYLALMPIEVAARLWFGLNVAMLLLSAWLLTDGWKPMPRLVSFLVAVLFMPVLGSLVVGQFVFPVLLGAALLTFALRRKNIPLTALAAALLTFKPHLGGPVVLIALIHLYLRRGDFSRRAFKAILITGLFLFVIGFLADHLWPVHYLDSLFSYRDVSGVSTCGLCASLPVALVAIVTGQTAIGPALPLGLALFALLLITLFLFRRDLFRSPGFIVSLATLVTLLANPYLLNYDFALMIVPLFALAVPSRRRDWIWLALAYLLPLFLLGMFGRAGSLLLPIPVVLLLSLQLRRESSIDASTHAA